MEPPTPTLQISNPFVLACLHLGTAAIFLAIIYLGGARRGIFLRVIHLSQCAYWFAGGMYSAGFAARVVSGKWFSLFELIGPVGFFFSAQSFPIFRVLNTSAERLITSTLMLVIQSVCIIWYVFGRSIGDVVYSTNKFAFLILWIVVAIPSYLAGDILGKTFFARLGF